MRLLFVPLSVLISLLIFSCNTTEPPINQTLSLKLEDVSCTEAWIQFSSTNIQIPNNISLLVNGSIRKTFTLSSQDSLLYIDSLLPNQNYTLQVSSIQPATGGQESSIFSNELSVTTMDTTSHNFTWQTFTFGGTAGSSTLYDVAIINENDIWAVGEIYVADTSQNGCTMYNAVHWNGQNWELKRIQTIFKGSLITVPLEGVFAFSSTDIWMVGSLPIHGDGETWAMYDLRTMVDPNLSLSKAWGYNSSNMYFVGNAGSIAHYNGSSWIKIENGTTTDINDIWGINDPATNSLLVLCTVSSRFHIGDYKLLSISGSTASEYISWPYTRLYGVWFNSPRSIYIVGDGPYEYKNNSLKKITLPTNYFLTRVKGNALNDIFIASSDAYVYHYNGINWNEILNGIHGGYEGMDVNGNTVVLVGYNIEGGIIGKAVITIGKHTN